MENFNIYSPVEQIHHPLFDEKLISVFIKRDDMIHPFISGNKWRKLKYLLQSAKIHKKTHLVTFGGAWSNHLLATACAAAKFGFRSTAFVRGEEINNPVINLCKIFGMDLLFTSRESYRDKKALFKSKFANDSTAFFIDEGGASIEAVRGCAELIYELTEDYDHIFCACGTGTTAAGILNGLNSKNLQTRLHAVAALKNGSFILGEIAKFSADLQNLKMHLDYHFGGYAKTTPQLLEFIKNFSSATGILLDPVYTGKLIYGFFDLAKEDFFTPGDKILLVHTGGLIGLLGKI